MAATLAWTVSQVGPTNFHLGQSSKVVGSRTNSFSAAWAKVAGDGDGSIWYLAYLPADAVLRELKLMADALTGATSVSVGFMRLGADGVPTDDAKNDGTSGIAVLMAATDISAGYAVGSDKNALSALAIADTGKKIWDLLGYSFPNNKKDDSFVLAIKFGTAGSAAGNLAIRGQYHQG